MAGILLILLILSYIGLTVFLLVVVKPIWLKPLVLIVAYLIPNADDMINKRDLAAYCDTQAGFKVYENASKNEAVEFKYLGGGMTPNSPLQIVEYHDSVLSKTFRYERQSDKQYKELIVNEVTAPYEFIRVEEKRGVFLALELLIRNRKTGAVLGRFSNIYYYGGWWRRGILGGLADSGSTLVADCGYENKAPDNELLKKVFSGN